MMAPLHIRDSFSARNFGLTPAQIPSYLLRRVRADLEIKEEIKQLEAALASGASSTINPLYASGRLAELYLQLPDAARYAPRAEQLAHAGAEVVGSDSPFYPKYRHFEAMAMRKAATPKPGALGEHGVAAEIDREAFERSVRSAPKEGILVAAEWADWAWEQSRWMEVAEAYQKANLALRSFVRSISDPDEKLKILRGRLYGSRSAYATRNWETHARAYWSSNAETDRTSTGTILDG